MTVKQRNLIRFVAEHAGSFATPHKGGGVWLYSYATDRNRRLCVVRDLAANLRECRDILGY